MPELHIITGSNGAGKSTIGPDYLPGYITKNLEIFNGDKLFQDKQKELWKKTLVNFLFSHFYYAMRYCLCFS